MDRPKIGVVIPMFNEAKTIAAVINGIKSVGVPIVVNDGSTDRSPEIARQCGAVVVDHEINRGYDYALNSGFAKASELDCAFIITIDADGQHNPELLHEFIDKLNAGADLVLGIRDQRQRFSEHLFAWIGILFYGVKDPLCGMKGYRLEVYRKLGHFDSYGSIGTELALFGVKSGCNFVEIKVETQKREGNSRFGKSNYGNYLILKSIFKSFIFIKPVKYRRS